jgi:hypothetical protein
MGLDMYLNKRIRTDPLEEKIESVDLMYWRKVNSIHKFFVDTVQDGVDDCGDYHIPKQVLKELIIFLKEDIDYLKSCEKEIIDKQEVYIVDEDKINLKTQSGFFFGSTNYSKEYVQELENTIKTLEGEDFNNKYIEYEYRSSW